MYMGTKNICNSPSHRSNNSYTIDSLYGYTMIIYDFWIWWQSWVCESEM